MTKKTGTYLTSKSTAALIDQVLMQQRNESQRLSLVGGQIVRFLLGLSAACCALMIACSFSN